MKLLTALHTLQNAGVPIIETRDAAIKLGVSNQYGSQMLRRMALEKHVIPLSRGLWALDTKINPLILPDYLMAPFPCYTEIG